MFHILWIFKILIILITAWSLTGEDQESKESLELERPALMNPGRYPNNGKVSRTRSNLFDKYLRNSTQSEVTESDLENSTLSSEEYTEAEDVKEYKSFLADTKRNTGQKECFQNMLNFDRYIDPKLDYSSDCFFKNRISVAPHPGNCYNRSFSQYRNAVFWAFWKEVHGDIRFAFDFVLDDKIYHDKKENQFWYLIAFLRAITLKVENPMKIIEGLKKSADLKSKLDYIHHRAINVRTASRSLAKTCAINPLGTYPGPTTTAKAIIREDNNNMSRNKIKVP